MQVELTQSLVVYQAQTKLNALAVESANTRKSGKINELLVEATKIRLWLKALQFSQYLDKETIDKLVYCLADLCDANAIAYAPSLTSVSAPSIVVGIKGPKGDQGDRGEDGGGTDFSAPDLQIDTIIDSFGINEARGVRWEYTIIGATGMRVDSLVGGWSADGTDFGDTGAQGTDEIYGNTDAVSVSLNVTGSVVSLIAFVSSGTWTITGSRYFIPNNGAGILPPTALTNGKIWIGNVANVPTENTVTGVVSMTAGGVTSLGTGVITNVHINAAAAIAFSKMVAMAVNKVAITDASGFITTSALDASKLLFSANVTSDIQAQLNALGGAGTITGAITPYVAADATASRVIISNPVGKLGVSTITTTEVTTLAGISGNIQVQFAGKQDTITGAASTVVTANLTSGALVGVDGSGKLTSSLLTAFAVTQAMDRTNQSDLRYRNVSSPDFSGRALSASKTYGPVTVNKTDIGSVSYNYVVMINTQICVARDSGGADTVELNLEASTNGGSTYSILGTYTYRCDSDVAIPMNITEIYSLTTSSVLFRLRCVTTVGGSAEYSNNWSIRVTAINTYL